MSYVIEKKCMNTQEAPFFNDNDHVLKMNIEQYVVISKLLGGDILVDGNCRPRQICT